MAGGGNGSGHAPADLEVESLVLISLKRLPSQGNNGSSSHDAWSAGCLGLVTRSDKSVCVRLHGIALDHALRNERITRVTLRRLGSMKAPLRSYAALQHLDRSSSLQQWASRWLLPSPQMAARPDDPPDWPREQWSAPFRSAIERSFNLSLIHI